MYIKICIYEYSRYIFYNSKAKLIKLWNILGVEYKIPPNCIQREDSHEKIKTETGVTANARHGLLATTRSWRSFKRERGPTYTLVSDF